MLHLHYHDPCMMHSNEPDRVFFFFLAGCFNIDSFPFPATTREQSSPCQVWHDIYIYIYYVGKMIRRRPSLLLDKIIHIAKFSLLFSRT